jgi:Ca2+-binding EF-hand superfamily protein
LLSEFKEVAKDLLISVNMTASFSSSLNDIQLIFNRYDKDKDTKLSYDEFIQLLLPYDVKNSALIAGRRDIRLSSDAVDLLRRIIRAYINIE